jgi:hypothetical protein
VIALPPVFVGAVHETAMVPVPPTAVTPVGAAGAVEALTRIASEACDTSEVVLLPAGVTVKVYESPLVKPVTVQVCAPVGGVVLFATTQLALTALVAVDAEVTVYVEATPSAWNETATAPLAANATVGVAKGVVPTEIDADASDTPEVVLLPLGVTVKVYDEPLVRPDTVQLCAPVGGVVVFTIEQLALGEPEAVLTV